MEPPLEQAITLGFPPFKQRGRVRGIARWLALGKGAINQKVGHLLRFPPITSISHLHHPASSPSRERACRCTGKLRIGAGYPGSYAPSRSYSGPHLTCIKYPQTLEVLCKIHDGECGNHAGGRSLAQKALSIGYFWPTMRQDSTEYAQRCDRCQRYKPVPGLPAEEYHPQNSPWPFMQWAIDLVGPMPTAPAHKEMMIVATDYFTKWIEAEALSSTKEADVERFIWKNIICRFGCPQSIVTDNAPVNPQIPARQWPSRGIQQDSAGLPKEKTGRRIRKMGRRAARSPMGLSHDQKEIDWRDSLFPGLWDRSNHPPTRHSPFHEH
ncbi:unnamed protein product [Prunus brigantina]